MGNRADDFGTDVEFYVKALTSTIYAATPTGAPEKLLALLDRLGLERQEVRTGGPVYTWHEVPAHLDADEQRRVVAYALPVLLLSGYEVSCASEVFDEAAYYQARRDINAQLALPSPQSPAPAALAPTARSRRSP